MQNDYVYADLRISKKEVAALSKQNDSTFVNKIFKLLLNDEILKKYCSVDDGQGLKDRLHESNEYKMMKCKLKFLLFFTQQKFNLQILYNGNSIHFFQQVCLNSAAAKI